MKTKRTTIKEKADILRKILVAKIAAKRQVVARKTKSVLIRAFILANILPFAQANAQSRGDSNQGNRYEYVQQPDGSFKMVEVTNNRPAAPQQRRSRNTPGRQSAQEIFNSLPSYTRALIQEEGYQILPEFQGGKTTGLNRPQSGVVYACAVQDPSNADNVLFLPIAQAISKRGGEYIETLPIIRCSKEEAYNMMQLRTNVYDIRSDLVPSRAQASQEDWADIYAAEDEINRGNRKAEIKGQQATKDMRHARKTAEEVIYEVNSTIGTVQSAIYTVGNAENTIHQVIDMTRGRGR